MNRVDINVNGVSQPSWIGSLNEYALKVLQKIKCSDWVLSILLCDDKTITKLNKQYRGKSEATDVLSFNLGETVQEGDETVYLPGDIVISLETLHENAAYFQIPEDEELRRLVIHGILHLDGMDHKTIEKTEPMLMLQEEILNSLMDENIIPGGEK